MTVIMTRSMSTRIANKMKVVTDSEQHPRKRRKVSSHIHGSRVVAARAADHVVSQSAAPVPTLAAATFATSAITPDDRFGGRRRCVPEQRDEDLLVKFCTSTISSISGFQ